MFQQYIFGEFIKSDKPLSLESLEDIFMKADRALGKIQELPIDRISEVLDQLANLWLDRDFQLRRTALERIPAIVGCSREMAELAIDTFFSKMKRENIQKILRGNLGRPSYLDRFEYIPGIDSYIKAQPLGIVLHVSPGNVFVGGADSLLYGFLSKNVNILKISRHDPLFPFLFAHSLKYVDEEKYLCNSLAILSFPHGDRAIEDMLKKRCDGIVCIGGEEAVRSYREDLPLGTRLIEYGPKYSFSIVTADGFNESKDLDFFERCANDVVLWDQRACSSPQVIYVEKGILPEFRELFPKYLEKACASYPQQNLSMDEKIEILKVRETARFREAMGEAIIHQAPRSHRWTVIYDNDPDFALSPLNRTVFVKAFSSWGDILARMINIRDYLQTVGIEASSIETKRLAKALCRVGVSRIARIGFMGREKLAVPHDFDFPLRKLVKWVSIEWLEKRFDLGDRIAPLKPSLSKWNRLKNLLRYARYNSPFYGEHLHGVDLKSLNDYQVFCKVPLLDKEHIYENTPPKSEGMLTGDLRRAYVFASGGSTGEPKFNFYSYREFDEVSSILSEIYQIAGVGRDDVVANLFMAGSLWTSFIVVNHALEKIGCVSLPIAGNVDIDLIIRYMQLFRPTTVVGLPSMIIQLAETVKQRSLEINIDKILYGGEHFSREAIDFLRQVLGTRLVHSAGYASVDAGPIGYQCEENTGGVHHLLYEHVFLEIVDPKTGMPVKTGETGEIVVTNLHRRLMPVIRYRTGDMGRMLERTCKCMHPTPLFELMGRCDDVIRIGGMSIYPGMISEIVAKFKDFSSLFQIEARTDGIKENLIIHLEAVANTQKFEKLEEEFRRALIEAYPEIELVVSSRWMGDIEIRIHQWGVLKGNSRTGKIKKVIDNRERISD